MANREKFHLRLSPEGRTTAAELLVSRSGLSKKKVKEALAKGSVWLTRPGWAEKRIRKANFPLGPKDRVDLHYDEAILARSAPDPLLLDDRQGYSLWYKPPGLLSQGSRSGDHCALTRRVEQHFHNKRAVRLVHRLDRETFGLILLGHTRKGAAGLSRLLAGEAMVKEYRAEVHGLPAVPGQVLTIDQPLDDKPAKSTVTVLAHRPQESTSLIQVRLHSGRSHQIRRHLAALGHPLLGDPRYGRPHPSLSELPLQLCAWHLAFACPISGQAVDFSLGPAFFQQHGLTEANRLFS